jgi:hypothetical protein
MKHRFMSILAVLALALWLAACGPQAPLEGCTHGSISRIYLGQDTPTGAVTDAQWQRFVIEAVTPRFPEGFTVLAAHGQRRAPDGAVRQEDTVVLEIVHDDSPLPRSRVRAIADEYKRRFAQHGVLVTQSPLIRCTLTASTDPWVW